MSECVHAHMHMHEHAGATVQISQVACPTMGSMDGTQVTVFAFTN